MPVRLSPSRHLRVGRSKAGMGLFSRVAIKKGQFIVRYSGRKLRAEAADELDTRYLFEVNTR
jgi:SET domain-containing protein